MKISDFILEGKVNSTNLNTFAKPFLVIVFIFLLFFLVVKIGGSQIKLQVSELSSSRKSEEELSIKLSKLTDGNRLALDNANKLVVALPQKNSVMVMISQLKKLALEEGLTVGKLEISGLKNVNNLNSIQLETTIQSLDISSLLDYLNELSNLAPMSSVFSVKVSSLEDGKFEADMELSAYWADFPSTIPSVRDPITSLSQSELAVIETVSRLREPDYQILEPLSHPDRTEPFN